MDYQQMYHLLFNRVTDAIEALRQQNYGLANDILMSAQCAAEELFLQADEVIDPIKSEAEEKTK